MNVSLEIKEVANVMKKIIVYSISNSGLKVKLIRRYFYHLFDLEVRRIGKRKKT